MQQSGGNSRIVQFPVSVKVLPVAKQQGLKKIPGILRKVFVYLLSEIVRDIFGKVLQAPSPLGTDLVTDEICTQIYAAGDVVVDLFATSCRG